MNQATHPVRRSVLAYLDVSGASMSTACAVHCGLMPGLLGLSPFVGLGILADERTEVVLLTLSASLGIASLSLGYTVHRSRRALAVLAAGLCFLISGRIAEGRKHETIGMALIVGGGLVLAGSHLVNRRCCRSAGAGRPSLRLAGSGCPVDAPGLGEPQ